MRRAALLCLVALLVLPAAAQAHAVLERTTPRQGADVAEAPQSVGFFFNEAVEASLGGVRVFNSNGTEVQSGSLYRPGGDGDAVAVHLRPELGDGSYTATFHVISADSHPVSGGFTFAIGKPTVGGSQSVSDLLAKGGSGKVTSVAFWADRWLGYLALGLALGLALFGFALWPRALAAADPNSGEWVEAARAFTARLRRLLIWAVVGGAISALLALPLEAAVGGAGTFWKALDPSVLGDVSKTRFGTLTELKLIAWVLLAVILIAPPGRRLVPTLRRAQLGATGVAPTGPSRWALGAVSIPLAFLAVAPALIGHASTQDPGWLLFPLDVVHVVAMGVWFGGLVALVAALPAATGHLEPPERTRLLLAALSRFSPLALAAVIAIAVTGTVQAIAEVGSFHAFVDTGFGRAVLIKIALLVVLIGLGAANRQRLIPALRRALGEGQPPGTAGRSARRNLRAEVSLIAVVLAVTAALVGYAPADQQASGPASGRVAIGADELEYTVDPATIGANSIHLYLFDADTGASVDNAKELTLTATEQGEGIGPLDLRVRRAGPGHFVAQGAQLGVAGEWRIEATVRTSRFDQDQASFDVPIK